MRGEAKRLAPPGRTPGRSCVVVETTTNFMIGSVKDISIRQVSKVATVQRVASLAGRYAGKRVSGSVSPSAVISAAGKVKVVCDKIVGCAGSLKILIVGSTNVPSLIPNTETCSTGVCKSPPSAFVATSISLIENEGWK